MSPMSGSTTTKHVRLREQFRWLLTPEFDKLREDFIPVDNSEFMVDPRRKPKANAENSPPYTNKKELTEKQFTELLSIVSSLSKEKERDYSTMEIDMYTFSGENLRQRLVEGGKFNETEATEAIEIMLKRGALERVAVDTYRLNEK